MKNDFFIGGFMSVIGFKKSAVLLFAFAIWFLIASLYAFEVKTLGSSFFKTKLTRVSSAIDLDFSNSVTKLDFLLEWSDKVEPVLINTVAYEIESKYEGKGLAPISTKGKSFAPVEGTKSLPFVNNKGSSSSLKKVITGTTKISFGIQTEIGNQGPEFDTSQNWAVLNQLKLVNKKNLKVWPADGYIVEMMENRTASITYHFLLKDKALGDFSDWNLVYKSVTAMKYQDVPFQFDMVPIP